MFEHLPFKNDSVLRSDVDAFIFTTRCRYSELRSGKAFLRVESRIKLPVYYLCFTEGMWTIVRLRRPVI